ncbi:uncharacterized protein MYCFIDRAFT_212000 [Pseudocercospora fijiensis CIRAD86]|uniref:Uncharacterized protein n=1 Tax=Pseudocercospora fijiensis (strain CIRAD86) TaxID=383855 RepID=M2ZMC7_PSEFD|nr:uncharacterized protein MYCFIDRAFT_212000 [Pseudocercospora fijiensis CIRAD86]EME80224.1 hypothetical protein MYCFIDRAFT_212000 [Pseudocercospora fijiensis CIRAD86]
MHFQEIFEKSLNDNMYETDDCQPGRAPPAEAIDANMDLKKKGCPSPQPHVQDHELSEKKDHPPRFSTLFGSSPAPAPQPPPREYVREYYPEPKRQSGVFIPMPLFIIFAIILFFESTILFAYTVIGLYNNAPSRLFPWAGAGIATTSAVCEHNQAPSIINAPNFIVPGQGPAHQGTEIMTQFVTFPPTQRSSSTSSSSADTAAAITDIAAILGSLASSTTSSESQSIAIVTVAPERSTATSIKFITEDASGNVVSAQPTPTVTQTTFVDPPKSTA